MGMQLLNQACVIDLTFDLIYRFLLLHYLFDYIFLHNSAYPRAKLLLPYYSFRHIS